MEYPEYALKCNKSVHLPAYVFCLCSTVKKKTRSIEVCALNWFALKSYNKQFITWKVV